MKRFLVLCLPLVFACSDADPFKEYNTKHSVARNWNEALLVAIRNDIARPTVHARNLFHVSAVMYDAWAVYDDTAKPYLLGQSLGDFSCPFSPSDRQKLKFKAQDYGRSRQQTLSYAAYTLIKHRFANAPGKAVSMAWIENVMKAQGLDTTFSSRDYAADGPAALGLYLADCMIAYGLQDGSNEANGYATRYYQSVNPALDLAEPGNPTMIDPNRWQPLLYTQGFVGQGGFSVQTTQPAFVSPEWGEVRGFALAASDYTTFDRDSYTYRVCHDPGAPAQLTGDEADSQAYQWNHAMVALWSSHLDPSDGVLWDISPASLGNTAELPSTLEEMKAFYNEAEGGVSQSGHALNPYTGQAYVPQVVPRADYARVLVEFWSDGPSSETPPGHWFQLPTKPSVIILLSIDATKEAEKNSNA